MRLLSRLYDETAWRRRQWYARRPEARRRLARPVVSVGALAAGGSGKTPFAAALARMLVEMGERPAVLSRGYRRADPVEGAAVIRDFERTVGSLAVAGDEPWMLARSLDGVAVVVADDRHLAGRLAEARLGATVHVLDDGFQHLQLERGTDLVLLSGADLDDPRVLPAGRLRERLATARRADAVLLVDVTADGRARVEDELHLRERLEAARRADALLLVDVTADGRARVETELQPARLFHVKRRTGPVRVRRPDGEGEGLAPGSRVAAVAGIARPGRFFDDLRAAGFDVARTMTFADHHRYGRRDADRIAAEARRAGAEAIVTTDKDFVRLEPRLPFEPVLATMLLTCVVTPEAPFRAFIAGRLAAERSASR